MTILAGSRRPSRITAARGNWGILGGPVLVCLAGFIELPAQSPLERVATPVSSIAFDAADADYLLLMQAIGNARVVVLGEATHSDGAASLAKARVARFLHERMGFDILAWESGFLQSYAMNEALRDPAVPMDSATSFLMSGGWAWDQAIQPLFQYARDSWRTGHPLVMAGFDSGRPRTAAPYFLRLIEEVVARAPWVKPAQEDWTAIAAMARRGFGFLSSELTPAATRQRERTALQRFGRRLAGARDSLMTRFSERHLDFVDQAIEHLLVSEQLKEARGVERAYGRDREMARVLRWLIEESYPGRKVIVWAATAHFTRNSDLISNSGDSTFYVVPYEAGNHLASWFGDDLYTIAFTSYAGELGEVHPEGSPYPSRRSRAQPTGAATVETALHGLGYAYAFLDVDRAVRSGALPEEFISAALGRLENAAPWARVIDALFFVDQSQPVRFIH